VGGRREAGGEHTPAEGMKEKERRSGGRITEAGRMTDEGKQREEGRREY